MNDDDRLEQLLRDSIDHVDVPDGGMERAASHARNAVSHRRRVRRRRRVIVIVAAGALAAGAMIGSAIIDPFGSGASLPLTHQNTPHEQVVHAALTDAPWLFQPKGAVKITKVRPRQSLSFPKGTTYAQAVTQLTRSVIGTGRAPAKARLVAPLPAPVVWSTRGARPRLSLTAPFGFTLPEGLIRAPNFAVPASVPRDEALRIARAFRDGEDAGPSARLIRVEAPKLAACQIQRPRGVTPRCRLD